jgi:hypothetical protein
MTKITADHLARQDKSFIPAKGIKLTKIGERSNSNVAYTDERDITGLFCDEIPVEQCLSSASLVRPPSS